MNGEREKEKVDEHITAHASGLTYTGTHNFINFHSFLNIDMRLLEIEIEIEKKEPKERERNVM
jgi:hypothetical protein